MADQQLYPAAQAGYFVTDQTGRKYPAAWPAMAHDQSDKPEVIVKQIKLVIGEPPPKHPDYTARKMAFDFFQASYRGGAAYRNARDADGVVVLPKHEYESPTNYKRRKAQAVYRNYCKVIINKYLAFIFGTSIVRTTEEVLTNLFSNTDGKQTPWDQFVEDAVRSAMIYGYWYVIADSTKEAATQTMQQAAARGDRIVFSYLNPARVISWTDNESELLIEHETPVGRVICLWTETEVIVCALDEKGFIAAMQTRPHGWRQMPICRFDGYEPHESMLVDLAEQGKILYNDDSLLRECHSKGTFPCWFIIGQSADDLREKAEAIPLGARRFLCLPNKDAQVVSANGDPSTPETLRATIAQDIAECYRIAGLRMPDVETGPESGRALKIRQSDTAAIAKRISRNAENSENKMLALVAEAYGRNIEQTVYSKNYDEEDLSIQLREALDVLASPDFGPMFKGIVKQRYIQASQADLEPDVLDALNIEAMQVSAEEQPAGTEPQPTAAPAQLGTDPGTCTYSGAPAAAAEDFKTKFEAIARGLEVLMATLDPDAADDGTDDGAVSGTSAGMSRGSPGELRELPGDFRVKATLQDVDPRKTLPQHRLDDGFVNQLAASMRTTGYDDKYPVLLFELPSIGRWGVSDGHHRVAGAQRAELKLVKAWTISSQQLDDILKARFAGALPKKLGHMDQFIDVGGRPYSELRESNKHTGGSQGSASK